MNDIIPLKPDEATEKYFSQKEELESQALEAYSVPSLRTHNSHVLKWVVHKLMESIRSKRGKAVGSRTNSRHEQSESNV